MRKVRAIPLETAKRVDMEGFPFIPKLLLTGNKVTRHILQVAYVHRAGRLAQPQIAEEVIVARLREVQRCFKELLLGIQYINVGPRAADGAFPGCVEKDASGIDR